MWQEQLRDSMKKKWSGRLEKLFGTVKLNSQINRLFTVIIIVYTLVLGFIMFYSAQRSMREYALESGESMLTSIGSNIRNSFDQTSTMSKMIMFSDEIMDYLQEEGETRYAVSYTAIRKIYSITNQFPRVKSVFIFKKNGSYINIVDKDTEVNPEVLQDAAWREAIAERAGGYLIQINGNGLFGLQSGEPVISFLRMIYDPETQKEMGIIAVNYTAAFLDNILQDLHLSNHKLAMISTDGEFLCGQRDVIQSGKQIQFLEEYQSEKFSYVKDKDLIYSYLVPDTPIRLISRQEMSAQTYYKGLPLIMIVTGAALAILCFMIIRFYISVWITRPIEKLVAAMKQVEQGWLHRVSVVTHTTEIRNLKDSYNQMLIQLNKLIGELVEQEKVAQQAKLDVMLEQLNPHFLYNTLETIGYMSLESPREEIYEAVESLGEFYRYFLNRGADTVPLKTEIAAVEAYLKIQKYRYGEILDEEYDIEPGCEECLVPKLILQPLVENSLYHGIRPKGEKGSIIIRAARQDALLVLTVYDTGIGMPPERIEKLQQPDGRGFGLRKTLERLKTIYGQEKTYEISSEEGVFCEIRLFVPFEKD